MHKLEASIQQLEQLQQQQVADIKESVGDIVNSLKPATIVVNALKSFGESPAVQTGELDAAISQGAGLLSYNLYVRGSKNIFRRLTGKAIQLLVTNFVKNKIPDIRDTVAAL